MLLEGSLHAATLLDLSDPNVVREGLLRAVVFGKQVMQFRLVGHHRMGLVEGGALLDEIGFLFPVLRERDALVVHE